MHYNAYPIEMQNEAQKDFLKQHIKIILTSWNIIIVFQLVLTHLQDQLLKRIFT